MDVGPILWHHSCVQVGFDRSSLAMVFAPPRFIFYFHIVLIFMHYYIFYLHILYCCVQYFLYIVHLILNENEYFILCSSFVLDCLTTWWRQKGREVHAKIITVKCITTKLITYLKMAQLNENTNENGTIKIEQSTSKHRGRRELN